MIPLCRSVFSVSVSLHLTTKQTLHKIYQCELLFIYLFILVNKHTAQSCFCKMLLCSFTMLLAHSLNSDSPWYQLRRNVKVVMFYFLFICLHQLFCRFSAINILVLWNLITLQIHRHQCFCCLVHRLVQKQVQLHRFQSEFTCFIPLNLQACINW